MKINLRPPLYDPVAVQPMRDELLYVGFEELNTPDKLEEKLDSITSGSTLVVINSVCGCAAGSARPGVTLALQHKTIPGNLYTVFAGQDRDSIDLLRSKYLAAFPPSSPSVALFKDGEVVHMMHRYQIEGRGPQEIADDLIKAFDKHCDRQGPAISQEAYAKLVHARACGSKIPLHEN